MDYYDTYLPYIVDDGYDRSYPAPEMQFLWRLDDLQDRLEELIANGAPYRSACEIIEENKTLVSIIAEELLRKNYLTYEDIEGLIHNAKC